MRRYIVLHCISFVSQFVHGNVIVDFETFKNFLQNDPKSQNILDDQPAIDPGGLLQIRGRTIAVGGVYC